MLTICIIEGHNSEHLNICLDSISKNTSSPYALKVFKEENTREQTLNTVLNDLPNQDLIIAADDIVFTSDWDKNLLNHWNENRILGFSMLYPKSKIIQNRGYRIISIDDVIASEALDNGLDKDEVNPFSMRQCQSITGCFQAIPSKIINAIPKFPLEGRNRLGELLYHSLAIRKGFEVVVLGHFMEHYAVSTKKNPNQKLRSESYLSEKSIWKDATEQFKLNDFAEVKIQREIDQELIDWLNDPCVMYGAGTITEFISANVSFEAHTLCSGLKEEDGKELNGKLIKYKDDIEWLNCQKLLITVQGKEKMILKDVLNLASHLEVCAIFIEKTPSVYRYKLRKIHRRN